MINKIRMRSTLIIIEDYGEESVDQHSKKDNERQDPSLWKKIHICFSFESYQSNFKVDQMKGLTCDRETSAADLFQASTHLQKKI